LSVALILAGALAILVAVDPELVGRGGQPGISTMQITVALFGFFSAASGFVLVWSRGRESIENWLLSPIDHEQHVQPTRLLLIAVWFGLVTGLGEVTILGISSFHPWSRVQYMNPHVYWMAPLSDVALFGSLGVLLIVAGRRLPGVIGLRRVAFVFGLLGFLGLSLLFQPELHNAAALVLAVGLAVQCSRLITFHAGRFHALVQRTLPYLVAGIPVLGLCVAGYLRIPDLMADLPPASQNSPNVLLIVLDTVRAQNLSLYGYQRQTTPWLEQFAKTGIRFDRALATSSWTLESHASMFTGELPHKLFASWQTPQDYRTPLDDKHLTLAEALTSRGYSTAGFVGNLLYCTRAHGLDRGFVHYEDYVASLEDFLGSSSLGNEIYSGYREMTGKRESRFQKTAPQVNQAFLHWLARQNNRPFFVFLNYFDAHDPYTPPEPYDLLFASEKPRGPRIDPARNYRSDEIRDLRDAYDGSIAYLDKQLSSLFSELQKQGRLENTLVIITSDHGEQFGEHGLMTHGNSLYRQLVHVPLVLSFPSRVPVGGIVREPVSLVDLPATVIDLVGMGKQVRVPGRSLGRHWNGMTRAEIEAEKHVSEILVGKKKPDWWPPSWPVYKGGMKSLVSGGFHYIKNGDGREELYDFERDSLEQHDLSRTENGSRVIEQMRQSLKKDYGL